MLSAEEIRTLEFGRAIVVARAARPIEVSLTPWWKRKDGKEIAAGKAEVERRIAGTVPRTGPPMGKADGAVVTARPAPPARRAGRPPAR